MTYPDQWKALSSRIRGLMQAGKLHAQFLQVRSGDPYGASKRLREQCEGVLTALRSFRADFEHMLPFAALARIDDFLATTGKLVTETGGAGDIIKERAWTSLVLLGAFESEMSFILSDIQESIRARADRAFAHLQRSIVVDSVFRAKWQTAFDEGEVQCEKLGAVHLLLHGIWAFKVNADGARTDLVFQEPALDLSDEQRYVDGFVLTEWKRATDRDDAAERFRQARAQAQCYAQGVLAGSELTAYRYAVVVSRQQMSVPDDLTEGEIIYRHVNIAVDPLTPSRG